MTNRRSISLFRAALPLALLPLISAHASLTLSVETPGDYLTQGFDARFDLFGGGGSGIRTAFAFDEGSLSAGYSSGFGYTEYGATFNVSGSSVQSLGFSMEASGGWGAIRAFQWDGSSLWDYEIDFGVTVNDPSLAEIMGNAQFLAFGDDPSKPEYQSYAIEADPYFASLTANTILFANASALAPEDFVSVFLQGAFGSLDFDMLQSSVTYRRDNYDPYSFYQPFTSYHDTLFKGANWDGSGVAFVAAPEPSTYGLAGVAALAALAFLRRLRARRCS